MLHSARQLLPRSFRRLLAVPRAQLVIHQEFGYVPARLRLRMMAQRRDGVVNSIGRRQSLAFQQNCFRILGIHFDRAIDQFLCFVRLATLIEPLRISQVGLRRFLLLAHHAVKLGQSQLHPLVFGLDFQQAMQHFDGFLGVVRFQVGFGDLQEQGPRFA